MKIKKNIQLGKQILLEYINKLFFFIKKNLKKTKKKESKSRKNLFILRDYLTQAGYDFTDERILQKKVFHAVVWISVFFLATLTAVLFYYKVVSTNTVFYLLIAWVIIFFIVMGFSWLIIYVYLDLKIYQRTKDIEEVLPDFLQLASANISAGMPVDQALWFAVRPNFGVLAKEIEDVAKSTIAGEDLEKALLGFTQRYKSLILKRSINLMIEGMRAGGEMADLLSRIALDIQETKLMRKEIAASVMTYVIFISFATIFAAPFLFALSTQLLSIVQGIMSELDLSKISSGSFNMNASGDSIKIRDFRIFSVLILVVSSIFSASIVSVIRRGNVKDGVKLIPTFVVVSLVLYFIANYIVGSLMGTFI